MENKQKMIGGVSIDRWKQAFADVAAIAIDNDYFSDNGKRLICRVIENCQKIVNDTFELGGEYISRR